MDSTFEWYFKGFSDELSAELKYIEPLPNRPVYHMGQQGEVFHPDWSIRVNVEHILGDAENLARIPAKVRKLKNLPLLLETAAELARRKAIIEPGIVVAQAYAGRGQFLLPMYLTDTNKPDIAMTLSLMDGYNYLYYDPFGNLKTEVIYTDDTNEEGNQTEHSRTEYTYDTLQRPLSKEVYDGVGTLLYKELSSYEITSDYVKETVTLVGDENNPSVVKSTYYNKYGDKIKSEIGSDYETYTTDYSGKITSVKSARANSEGWNESHLTEYDFMGNVLKETDELGNITRSKYDQLGRCVKSYDANNYASEFKYDNLGRIIEQRTPFEEKDGTVYYSVKRMWYDNNGNVVKERVYTNAAGESESFSEVKYTYNSRNKLIMTESNDGEKSNYVQNFYDAKGNLLRVYTGLHSPLTINGLDDVTAGSDAEYAVTKYDYDKLGRLLSTTDALNKTETNTYDLANSLVLSSVDRNGNTFAFEYDGLGNQKSKSLSDGTNAETIIYGLTGQPLSMQNNTTAISYVYNDKGQLISETDSASGTVKTYTYNAAGSVASMTVTRNGVAEINQSYAYDKLNRLISVSENGTVIAAYTYDNKNNRTQTVAVGGETTNYSYNLANVITSLECGDKLNETYSYYLNGNQKSKVSNGQTTNYVYDSMNRLISENNTQYTFDDFGNRLTMSDGETITEYYYDLNNRLTESNEVTGDVTATTKFFYDYNGNQITKAVMVNQPYTEGMSGDYTISDTSSNYIALYEYNCYNQLVGVDTNGIISSYAYSPDGLRHSKMVYGNTITYVYDNANVIEEITTDGVNKYYRGIEIIKNDDGLNYIYNGHGDVSLLTDSAGATVANYNFDAYGNQSQENTVYNPFGYRGEYTDSESGLVYLRARMYDPETGRFINEDPAKDNYNWYIYCSNNPIALINPFGLFDYNDRLGPSKGYNHDVAVLQNELVWLGYYSGEVDGYFGQKTLDAVNWYKYANNLGNTGSDWGIVGAQTWSSLGLIYRTQQDIDAGVQIINGGVKQYFDISVPVTTAVQNAKTDFENHKLDVDWFIGQVKNQGRWNVKRNAQVWSDTLVISTNSYNKTVFFYGRPVVIDDIGNITYGYLGKAASFPGAVLKSGSMGYHILNHGIYTSQ